MDCGDRIQNIFLNSIHSQDRSWVKITNDLQQDLQYLTTPSKLYRREIGRKSMKTFKRIDNINNLIVPVPWSINDIQITIINDCICYTKNGGNNNSPTSLNVMVNYHYHGENRVITSFRLSEVWAKLQVLGVNTLATARKYETVTPYSFMCKTL